MRCVWKTVMSISVNGESIACGGGTPGVIRC
jgi:hypothetical protein